MPEPDCFLPYLQREILLRRENPTCRYWAPVAAATRGFEMILFTVRRGNNFVGSTCAPPSALLVGLQMTHQLRLHLRVLSCTGLSYLMQ